MTSVSKWSLHYSSIKPPSSIPDPPSYTPKTISKKPTKAITRPDESAVNRLREKRAWDVAISPAKNVPVQGFMMYMSGNSIQIYSLFTLYMLFKNALSGIFGVNQTFAPLTPKPVIAPPQVKYVSRAQKRQHEQVSLLPQKVIFILCQGLLLGLGLYKCHSMGLLPDKNDVFGTGFGLHPSYDPDFEPL